MRGKHWRNIFTAAASAGTPLRPFAAWSLAPPSGVLPRRSAPPGAPGGGGGSHAAPPRARRQRLREGQSSRCFASLACFASIASRILADLTPPLTQTLFPPLHPTRRSAGGRGLGDGR